MNEESAFRSPSAALQIEFFQALREIKRRYLREALQEAVAELPIRELDAQLLRLVKARALQRLASFGIRGEVLFPTPCLLETNPFLLGYYRLLYGLSQKEFYGKGGFARFKKMEESGVLPDALRALLAPLCSALAQTGTDLLHGIEDVTLSTVHELQLLTLGPQLRGKQNTKLGQDATQEVFQIVRAIVAPYKPLEGDRSLKLVNDSRRSVSIEFFSDPDIRVTEAVESHTRALLSIEIKGGADVSNIHNRLGEAETSHQKAKSKGFFEFWTILRACVPRNIATRESPTTSHFFDLEAIKDSQSDDGRLFRAKLASILGIRLRKRSYS